MTASAAPHPAGASNGGVPTGLFTLLGGQDAFRRLVAAMHERVVRDQVLQPLFAEVGPDHQARVVQWFDQTLREPLSASSDDSGRHLMAQAHAGQTLTEEQRRHYVTQMSASADDAGILSDPSLRAAFVAWLEWGTRIALAAAHGHPVTPPPAWLAQAAGNPHT